MIRKVFTMQLYAGNEQEYEKRHTELWPDLQKELVASGLLDFRIYLDKDTLKLFAVMDAAEDNTLDMLPEKPIMKKWWVFMADLMETHPDNSPVCNDLQEVFRLEK